MLCYIVLCCVVLCCVVVCCVVFFCCVVLFYFTSGNVALCCVVLCYVALCCVMLRYARLCYVISRRVPTKGSATKMKIATPIEASRGRVILAMGGPHKRIRY